MAIRPFFEPLRGDRKYAGIERESSTRRIHSSMATSPQVVVRKRRAWHGAGGEKPNSSASFARQSRRQASGEPR
jgi:hypothetical protein